MFDHIRKKTRSILDLADLAPDVILSRLGFDQRAKYLFEDTLAVANDIESDPKVTSRGEAFRRLRQLGLDDFAYLLWSMPNPRFPRLSELLPAMADTEVQRHWTGRSGVALLKPTVNFVRIVAYNYARLTGSSLDGSKQILDYGCGYGRIARLMYYFVEEENVTGVDPWGKSIDLCRRAGLGSNFVQSEYLPTTLPVDDRRFHLIYAYSVFTHLSEHAALSALAALRKYIRDDGVLVITVRPIEYWDLTRYIEKSAAVAFKADHKSRGFAFYPHSHEHATAGGSVVYGDASIALDWFKSHCPDWVVGLADRSLNDRLQTYLFLRPA